MMTRAEDDDGRPPPGRPPHVAQVVATTEHSTPAPIKTSRCVDSICAPRQCRRNTVGRREDAWREGFGYGFRDALRLAQREINDLDALLVLTRLAGEYELAAGDS